MKIFLCTCAVLALVPAGMSAHADDATCLDVAALVQKLKAQVEVLQARVQTLEQASSKTQASNAPSTTGIAAEAAAQLRREDAAVRQGWKQVKNGLTQDDVKGLLGAPQQIFKLSGKLVWYYSYPAVGGGSVMFDASGHSVGHQAPPFSAFGMY